MPVKTWTRDTITPSFERLMRTTIDLVYDYRSGLHFEPLNDDAICVRIRELRKTEFRGDDDPQNWFTNESVWAAGEMALKCALRSEFADPASRGIAYANHLWGTVHAKFAEERSRWFHHPKQQVVDKLAKWAQHMLCDVRINGKPPGSVYATAFLGRMAEIIDDECRDF